MKQPDVSFNSGALIVRTPYLTQSVRLVLCGDFHTAPDDGRGIPYRDYSARMAQYGTPDCQGIADAINLAVEQGRDAVFLLGDMLNFPSEKGVEELSHMIEDAKIPVYYISGNHDWHYEGLPGTDIELRKQWIAKRLFPLYRGRNPLMYSVKINGLKFIFVDDSVYEILPEQLDFLKSELADGMPAVLCVHIPLYIPGRNPVDFGCGHPDWGTEADCLYRIERRERWRDHHTNVTFQFYRTVFESENLLGIFAGHTHTESMDIHRGTFQYVVPYRRAVTVDFLPQ